MKIVKKGFMVNIEDLTKDDLANLFFIVEDKMELDMQEDPGRDWISVDWYNKLISEIKRNKIFG